MTRIRAVVADDRGFTLVELLVALVLSVIVVSVTTGTIVQSLKTQRREMAQVVALNGAKVAFERVTRDLRAMNPLVDATPTLASGVTTVDGRARTVTYRLSGTRLLVDERTVDAATGAVLADPPERVLLDGIVLPSGTGVFAYHGGGGAALPAPVDPDDVLRVTVRLRLPVQGRSVPVDLSSDVVLRNAES